MLFIKDWNKASLDKSSNSIVARYQNKISSLTDKTDALRKLLEELYDEAVILNERIKIDKQAIQEDLNDTADDLRATCGNSSWGQEEIKNAQDILDNAEEDIEDIKTDIEITTGCLVVCQSGQGTGCGQPSTPCNDNICLISNAGTGNCARTNEDGNCVRANEDGNCARTNEDGNCVRANEDGNCVVIVNGEFDCQGNDSYIQDCYGGCFNNQSCDSQTKVCPKCHGSEIDIIETCTECDTDQKETCGTFDDQDGCDTDNEDGNCNTANATGDCYQMNDTGDCVTLDNEGACQVNVEGSCSVASNDAKTKPDCNELNFGGGTCTKANLRGDCVRDNNTGDCYEFNNNFYCRTGVSPGTCVYYDSSKACETTNSEDQETCYTEDTGAKYCVEVNSESSDCFSENTNNDCNSGNTTGNCYSENATGDCTADNSTGDCLSQSCEAGQECTSCIEDQKESTTTEKCQAGANIGDEEYCDTCQGDESKVEEWDQEELEDLCSSIFESGANACGTVFADCFNAGECDGATWGAESGCGNGQGCGTCNENDTCSGGQECATGQTCTNNDCGQDCGQDCGESPSCGTCVNGQGSCWPLHDCVENQGGGQECALVVVGEPGTCDSNQSND